MLIGSTALSALLQVISATSLKAGLRRVWRWGRCEIGEEVGDGASWVVVAATLRLTLNLHGALLSVT